MVSLQQMMSAKQHFNVFCDKIVRQIHESTEVASIMLQKMESHQSEEALSEIRRIQYSIRDFDVIFKIA